MIKAAKDLGISKRISILRQHFNLTGEAMASIAGVSGTAISNLEQGRSNNPGAEMLANISSKLGVNLNWLLLGEGEMLKSAQPVTKALKESPHTASQQKQELTTYVTTPKFQGTLMYVMVRFLDSEGEETIAWIDPKELPSH